MNSRAPSRKNLLTVDSDSFLIYLIHFGFSTNASHYLNNQTEADKVGFQLATQGFLRFVFRFGIYTAIHRVFPTYQPMFR